MRSALFMIGTLMTFSPVAADVPEIKTTKVKSVFKNRFIEVQNNDVLFPGEKPGTYVRIIEGRPKAGAAVFVLNARDELLLVRSYRYGVSSRQWELPRGGSDGDEDFVAAGLRELKEETGLERAQLSDVELLGSVHPNTAVMASEVGLVFARVRGDVKVKVARAEMLDRYTWLPLVEVRQRVKDGRIKDGFTLAALLQYSIGRTPTR